MCEKQSADVAARLTAILSGIRRTRSSLYPSDWTFDPLHKIEQEIQELLNDLQK